MAHEHQAAVSIEARLGGDQKKAAGVTSPQQAFHMKPANLISRLLEGCQATCMFERQLTERV